MEHAVFQAQQQELDGTTDYQQTFCVKAKPEAVFSALTTIAGLSRWWTRVTGSGDGGGTLQFVFDETDPLIVTVEEATSASIRWRVESCTFLPDWKGTRPTFTIEPLEGNKSEITFRHHGLNAKLDCIEMCTRGWNHFLGSLREYVELGHGSPFGSPGDQARRVH